MIGQNVSHCYIHDVDEEVPDTYYQVCFECGHVYATKADLEQRYYEELLKLRSDQERRELLETGKTKLRAPVARESAGNIFFCQECLHDF